MKFRNCMLAMAMGAFILVSCSNDNDDLNLEQIDVPAAVLKSFETNFGQVKDVKWEKKNKYTIARFQTGSIGKSSDSNHTSAWFDDEGHQYQVDQEIPFNQLPAAVKDGFETIYNLYYAGWEIDDEAHVVDRLNMGLIYVIEIEKGKVERELSFSPIGILLKDVIDDDSDDILPVIVPDQIRELIESLFPHNPDVEILEIEDEDDGMLEVDVCDGGLHKEVLIGKDGQWLKTSYDVDFEMAMDMMDAINPDVLKRLVGLAASVGLDLYDPAVQQATEVTVVEDVLKGIYFEIEIEIGDEELELIIDQDGNISIED